MATDFEIHGKTDLDGSGVNSGLSAMTVAAGQLIGEFVQKAISGLQQVVNAGIDFNAQMQTYITNFTTMLGGNEQAAQALVGQLKELGASTPLAVADLTSAAQTLLNFGAADAASMTDTLKMIGDVALGDAGKMQALSLAYGQMYSTGKLQGQDLLQMINAGFNPLQELSAMGYGTVAELKEKMSDGAISVEMVQAAFAHATAEGGKFYNAMANASQTFSGRLSTLKDNATALAGSLTGALTDSLTDLMPQVNDAVLQLTDAFETGGMEGMLQAGASMVSALASQCVAALPELLASATDWGVQLLTRLADGAEEGIPQLLAKALPMLEQFTANLRENAGRLVDAGIHLLQSLMTGLMNALPELLAYVPQIVINLAGVINDNAPKLLLAAAELIAQLAFGLVQSIPTLLENLPQIITAIVDVFTAFNWISLGRNIIAFLRDGITSMIAAVQTAGTNVHQSLYNAIAELPQKLLNLGKSAIESLSTGVQTLLYEAQMAGVSVFNVIWNALAALPAHLLGLARDAMLQIISGIANSLSAVISAAGGLRSGIVNAIKALPQNLLSLAESAVTQVKTALTSVNWHGIGSNIIDGIISGIGAAIGGLVSAAANAAASALKAAKSALGIKSPSKRFRDEVGAQIPAGTAEGVNEHAEEAVDAARRNAEQMVAAAQSAVFENQIQTGDQITQTGITAQTTLQASWRGESVTILQVDGREVARTTAPYMDEQLNW